MGLEQTAKKPTRQEFKRKLKADRDKFEREHNKWIVKLQKLDANNHVYLEDKNVTISGSLFADFINNIGHRKSDLEQLKKTMVMMVDTIEYILNDNARITLELMKAHAHNIESGFTQKIPVTEESSPEN